MSTETADTPSVPTESAIVESAQVGEVQERPALDMMLVMLCLGYELRDPERAGKGNLPKRSTTRLLL